MDAIEDARLEWGNSYPRWFIRVVPTPSDLELTTEPLRVSMFWPEHLWRDYSTLIQSRRTGSVSEPKLVFDAALAWNDLVRGLCYQFWPKRFFVNPFAGKRSHPAAGIVSASLLYLSSTTIIPSDKVDPLIPGFQIEPSSLPYSPFQTEVPYSQAMNLGMLFYYERLIDDLFKDDPERLKEVNLAAMDAGATLEEKLYPHGPIPPEPRDWWWYIPILPGMSAEDLRRAESATEETARMISGDAPLDNMIAELKKEGVTHQRIADLIGVDISTVTRRLRVMREG